MKLEALTDAPGPEQGEYPDDYDDADRIEAAEFLEDLEALIETPSVQYARETLEGIYETVTTTGRVTKRQLRSVNNIEAGGDRHDQGGLRRT